MFKGIPYNEFSFSFSLKLHECCISNATMYAFHCMAIKCGDFCLHRINQSSIKLCQIIASLWTTYSLVCDSANFISNATQTVGISEEAFCASFNSFSIVALRNSSSQCPAIASNTQWSNINSNCVKRWFPFKIAYIYNAKSDFLRSARFFPRYT